MFSLVIEYELGKVLHIFKSDNNIGSDVWSVNLFFHFCEPVGTDLLKVVEESIRLGHMYVTFNSTFITLIPKFYAPKYLDDF